MSLYYEDEWVQLHHGDARLILGWTTADVLVTDPPYGVGLIGWLGRKGEPQRSRPRASVAGDDSNLSRDAVLGLWGARPALVFGSWKSPRPEDTRHRLIWDKMGDPGMGDTRLPWGNTDEEIYVLGHGWMGARGSNIIQCPKPPSSTRVDHPTTKPVALMEALIAKCPSGVIADPFAGSGSTLIAARNLGRKCIGVELEERYCELIVKRLSQQAFIFEET